jgi:Peptidase family S58
MPSQFPQRAGQSPAACQIEAAQALTIRGVIKCLIARAGLIPNDSMDPLFEATVQATEEAILNAMCAAQQVTGYGGTAYAITDPPASGKSLEEMLKYYNRYEAP